MKYFNVRVLIVSLCVGICSALLFAGAALGQSCEQWGGKIVSVQGVVQVKKAGESKWMPVGLNARYCPGDMIRVLKNSRAAIALSNETLFRLDQNTTISFSGVEKEKTFLIDLLTGVTHFFSRQPRRLKVVTPFLNAAVEGTEFYVRVAQDLTFLSIFEGRVAASNTAGSLVLSGGQSAVAAAGKAPVLRVVARPRDAVQWALYYLPVLYVPDGEVPKEDMSDPQFLAYRASQLLAVGRVDEAGADISQVLSLDPKYSDAFALQSIIAVVQNEKDKALDAAQKAVEAGPNSATARIALSYAQQANFDIQGALKSLQEAVKLGPDDALAWSRLAELFLSVGDLSKAAEAAQKAVALNPNLAHTQTVLGFTYIDRIKIRNAKEVFNKAILLDSAAPLPRLGLGLAKIRGGDLKNGRAEIEIAVSLDPNNSLFRSYLGKAYYEEKRDKLAENQYAVAKELDPLDPTAWFYDAIRKQTINRPVEALQDMQKSIELNDNRAVYRSRLLLDEDLAARSASLGRIYNNLGFQQTGLVEGWKSVNVDPANYSAHRLLADLYAAIPRHQVARVSELLQSQLLQPINITPIQPLLAESNLFILDGAGPSDPSFNEFNPLFLRNRFALQASAVGGGNDTVGDELVHSAVWNKLSYSLGQFHHQTNGFRENNDQKQDILNGFVQLSLSPETSIQGEIRHKDRDFGDLKLLFDPDRFSPNLRQDQETHTYRLGFHHTFTPKSEVIASVFGQKINEDIDDSNPFFKTERDEDTDGYLAEAQHLYRNLRFNTIAGLGYYDADLDMKRKLTPPFIPPSKDHIDIDHFNGYVYAYFKMLSNLTLTAGVSYDDFDNERTDENQFNPKFGLTWNPFPATTLRLAAFRVLTRTLIGDQTIEPTQVAGFNQFFDDVPGTNVWSYGAGIDQIFFKNLFGGLEFYKRDLDVPYQFVQLAQGTSSFEHTDWDEILGRAYLYWTPHPWLAASAEYLYEDFDRGNKFPGPELILDLKTHRLRLGCNFFHPSGFFMGLKASYVDQSGEFGNPIIPPTDRDSDNFWVVDAGIGYRLPGRFGLFSIEAKNVLDQDFKFQDTDPANPTIFPERQVLARITLAF